MVAYAWLDEERGNDDLMSGCLGIVLGVDEATVRQQLAVDEPSRRLATVHESWGMSESDFGNDLVQVSPIGEAVVTFEPNGWHGVEPDLALRLSAEARYVAYFWNVNSVMRFVFAEQGSIRRDFDPLLYDSDGEHEPALPEERDLPFPRGDDDPLRPSTASLALIARLTGVEITRSWLLEDARPTYRVEPGPPSPSSL